MRRLRKTRFDSTSVAAGMTEARSIKPPLVQAFQDGQFLQ
jgi:hypothetical protein